MKKENEVLEILLPLDADIINPMSGLIKLNEQTVSHQGKWRIHKNDPDNIFPSDPHADRVDESDEKLNLYTGEVYNSKKQYLYTLSKKSIQYIYHKIIKNGENTIINKLNENKSKITYLTDENIN
jgi:hypothetical protein